MIEDVNFILSALWVVLMLTYLLGDVMRIFAGDFKAGEVEGTKMTPKMLMGMAALMLIPIYGFSVLNIDISFGSLG